MPYVRWPGSIVDNRALIDSIREVKGDVQPASGLQTHARASEEVEFRKKFPPAYRATDGHMVRSRAELLIDNWLYMSEHAHAYERKLPVEEEIYSDFYIPKGRVYIEFWGFDENPRYLTRKRKKLETYKKYGFKLIELTDKEV